MREREREGEGDGEKERGRETRREGETEGGSATNNYTGSTSLPIDLFLEYLRNLVLAIRI